MIESPTRRETIAGLSTCIMVLAGCAEPAARELNFKTVDPPEENDEDFSIRTTISPVGRNIDPQDGAFRNVHVVGYLQSQRIVCQYEVGTLELGYDQQISLECSERPEYLTFTIGDAGCEYDTLISVLKVNSPNSELSYTLLEDKSCGDPELPVPDQ